MSSLIFRIQFAAFGLLALGVMLPWLTLAQQADTATTSSTTVAIEQADGQDNILPASYKIEQLPDSETVGDFVVGPGKVELEIAPGESKTVLISVSNRTGAAKLFTLEMEDAAGSQDPKTPIVLLGEQTGPYTMKDFIIVSDNSFIIEHNQRVRIPVTITLPKNAQPGGLYGSLLVTTTSVNPVKDTAAPRSAIVSRIGTLFFITVPGAVEKSGEMIEFSTVPPKTFYTEGPISMGILFENTGSMYLNPYGSITIRNFIGEEVGYVEIEPWFVLPKALRLREVTWDRELLLGRYTITAELNRGYDNIIDTKVIHVWVLPWQMMLGVFVVVFLMFIIVKFITSRFEFKRKSVR